MQIHSNFDAGNIEVVAIKPLAKIYSPIYELIKPLVPSCVALPQSALPQRFLNSNLQFHK